MNVASTFSGVGGMDLGLARAGYRHVLFAEIDEWRRRVLGAHWPGVPCYDDVRRVGESAGRSAADAVHAATHEGRREAGTRLSADLLCGGFPCQDLSVAGRRAGLAGSRSGLFHEFARIADTLRPRWILLENVPGLLSSNDGRDMGTVIGTMADLGYGVAWRVLDARYFGVPQRRRRVFIVGHLGSDHGSALRALCEGCGGDLAESRCSWQGSPAAASRGASGDGVVVSTLQAPGNGRGYRVDAESAAGGHLVANTLMKLHTRLDPEFDTFVATPSSVRRLTPIECERLMGWPDGWTAPDGVKAPDGRRYAACGDGVVANVAEWIGRRILAEHHHHHGDSDG